MVLIGNTRVSNSRVLGSSPSSPAKISSFIMTKSIQQIVNMCTGTLLLKKPISSVIQFAAKQGYALAVSRLKQGEFGDKVTGHNAHWLADWLEKEQEKND